MGTLRFLLRPIFAILFYDGAASLVRLPRQQHLQQSASSEQRRLQTAAYHTSDHSQWPRLSQTNFEQVGSRLPSPAILCETRDVMDIYDGVIIAVYLVAATIFILNPPGSKPWRRIIKPRSTEVGPSTTKVLETCELLEGILLNLSGKDLFVWQRVSSRWCDLIRRSPGLQKMMFLRRDGEVLQPSLSLSDSGIRSYNVRKWCTTGLSRSIL